MKKQGALFIAALIIAIILLVPAGRKDDPSSTGTFINAVAATSAPTSTSTPTPTVTPTPTPKPTYLLAEYKGTSSPIGQEFDHCFPLTGEHACSLAAGGIRMDLFTDLPAVQIYTGRYLHAPYGAFAGVAIEPEFYPDSPNQPQFPSTLLKAGEHFHRWAEYRFTAE